MYGSPLRSEADQDSFLLLIYAMSREVAEFPVGVDEEDVDDVVHDVALECLIKLRTGNWTHQPVKVRAFVTKLVRDRWIDCLRKRVVDAEHDGEHLQARAAMPPEWMRSDRAMHEAGIGATVQELLAKIPEKWRSAYYMVRIQHLPYCEAASRLGISFNTVHNYVTESQRILRNELQLLGVAPPYSPTGGRPRSGRPRGNQARLAPRYLMPKAPASRSALNADVTRDLTEVATEVRNRRRNRSPLR